MPEFADLTRTGYVLAGGRSSRMGTDKALLHHQGATLLSHIARAVAIAAGSVTIIGDPARYGTLGYPVRPDIYRECGPLAGIHAALAVTPADWNLVVACDMPEVEPDFLRELLHRAEERGADCLLPAGRSGRPEPLCGVYHRRALAAIDRALAGGTRKVLEGLAELELAVLHIYRTGPFRNINTAQEWTDYKDAQSDKTPEEGV